MPELPEVETIVRKLRPKLVGLRLRGAWSDREKTVRQAGGLKNLNKEIKNKKILTVRRRAKYILIDIEGPKTIFIHQKISGHLLYGKWQLKDGQMVSTLKGPLHDDSKNQHIRVVFDLSNGYQLALADLRRFGKVMLADDDKVNDLKEIRTLGPEPLDISYKEFKQRFEKKRGVLKQVLMDPKFVAGIGNIYSDEILWRAGLHPLSRVEDLSEKDIKNLYRDTQSVLKLAIKHQGSSVDDYRTPEGGKGTFQDMQKAYHQTGKKCAKKDGGVIERLKVGGRSAHFCQVHQVRK